MKIWTEYEAAGFDFPDQWERLLFIDGICVAAKHPVIRGGKWFKYKQWNEIRNNH